MNTEAAANVASKYFSMSEATEVLAQQGPRELRRQLRSIVDTLFERRLDARTSAAITTRLLTKAKNAVRATPLTGLEFAVLRRAAEVPEFSPSVQRPDIEIASRILEIRGFLSPSEAERSGFVGITRKGAKLIGVAR